MKKRIFVLAILTVLPMPVGAKTHTPVKPRSEAVVEAGKVIGTNPDPFIRGQMRHYWGAHW